MNKAEYAKLEARLRKGFKLTDPKLDAPVNSVTSSSFGQMVGSAFEQLSEWLAVQKDPSLLDKEISDQLEYVVEGLRWMDEVKAYDIPCGPFGRHFSFHRHWIPFEGTIQPVQSHFFNEIISTVETDLRLDGFDVKYVINQWFINTHVMLMSSLAYKIFSYFKEYHRTTADSLKLTISALRMLDSGLVDDHTVQTPKFLSSMFETMLQESRPDFRRLKMEALTERSMNSLTSMQSIINDPDHVLPMLISEQWCVPTDKNYFDDGWFHFITAPSWIFGQFANTYVPSDDKKAKLVVRDRQVEFDDNVIEDWAYIIRGRIN